MPGKGGLKAPDCLNKPSALNTPCEGLASVAPAYCCAHLQQPAPHTLLPSGMWPSRLLSRLVCFPEPGCQESPSPAVLWHQDSIEGPCGVTNSMLPPTQLLAGYQECPCRDASPGCRGCPFKGKRQCQPFPLSPCALFSWKRTETEQRHTCASLRCTCRAHRSPYERQPSGSLVSQNPQGTSLPYCSLAPTPAAGLRPVAVVL